MRLLLDETIKSLENISNEIKNVMSSKGINNTGDAANSLEIIIDEGNNSVKLIGNDYIYYLNYGRGAGKFPPVQNIRDWVRSKLGISDEKQNKQIGYLVGKKIAEQGTEIYKNNSKGIELDSIIYKELDRLYKKIPLISELELKTFGIL